MATITRTHKGHIESIEVFESHIETDVLEQFRYVGKGEWELDRTSIQIAFPMEYEAVPFRGVLHDVEPGGAMNGFDVRYEAIDYNFSDDNELVVTFDLEIVD